MRTLEVSTEACQETLMSLRVMEEEVGKIVADSKHKEYTHVIWADKAEVIWRWLEDNQPLPISPNNITPNDLSPYVPPHHHKTPSCPTTPPRQMPTQAASNNPFTDNTTTPHQNTVFNRLPYTPSTPSPQHRWEDQSQPLAFLAQEKSCLYINDESGHQTYECNIATWENIYNAYTQMLFNSGDVPLTPGMVALGSQECYGCGLEGHTASSPSCPLPEEACNNKHHIRECSWRNYINKTLYPPGSHTPICRMRLWYSPNIVLMNAEEVTYDPKLYDIESVVFYNNIPGNGMESCK